MINVECCARYKNLNENIGARNHMTPYMTYQPHYTRRSNNGPTNHSRVIGKAQVYETYSYD